MSSKKDMRSMFVPRKVVKEFHEPSRVKQSFARECDINNIMARYEKDGLISHVNRVEGRYGDFGGPPDYQEAMNKVVAAQDMFMSLPAKLRARFGNDPGEFLGFATDPKNVDEMIKMGLAVKREDPKPQKVEVVNPPAAKADDGPPSKDKK